MDSSPNVCCGLDLQSRGLIAGYYNILFHIVGLYFEFFVLDWYAIAPFTVASILSNIIYIIGIHRKKWVHLLPSIILTFILYSFGCVAVGFDLMLAGIFTSDGEMCLIFIVFSAFSILGWLVIYIQIEMMKNLKSYGSVDYSVYHTTIIPNAEFPKSKLIV